MIPIGERINGMFTDVKKAIAAKDPAAIHQLSEDQTKAGAKYLDINVGTAASDQVDAMKWLVNTIQEKCDTPLALDSQKLDVVKAGLEEVKGHCMINSCQADPEKLDIYLPLCKEYNAALVALCMDKDGVSQDTAKRLENAMTIVEKASEYGVPSDHLYIDPIILPINVDQRQPQMIFEAVSQIRMMADPAPHITVGLSNISQSTRERHLINRTMLVMLAAHGCDSAIVDVLDNDLMDAWITADLLMDKMIYSDSYLKAALA